MRPGTVRVKTGDLVGVGNLLGSCRQHRKDASGPVDANVSSPNAITFGEIGAQRPFKNDYPANHALVTFK
jgi:hypothetical protein